MEKEGSFLLIDNVKFSYGNRVILDGVTMKFGRGKVVAIMGGSGMGKTTLLKLVGGLLTPQSGRIVFDGKELDSTNETSLYAMRERMGMLFQFGALFTDLTVFENVAFPLRERTHLDEETISDLVLMKLNAVGLRGTASLMPSEISGGMARRVALARAIALDPQLILYDEPFAGLDPISMGVTSRLIRQLTDALNATAIVVTHDVAETFAIADYVYMINEGKVSGEGSPEAMNQSKDPFVRQFLDAVPDGPVRFHYPAPAIKDDFLEREAQ